MPADRDPAGCQECDPRSMCLYHRGYEDGRDEGREAAVAWWRRWTLVSDVPAVELAAALRRLLNSLGGRSIDRRDAIGEARDALRRWEQRR